MSSHNIGVSTACFYPEDTLKSLELTAQTGAKKTEIFMNSDSELEDGFLDKVTALRDKYGLEIVSMHPFASFAESYYLFGNYEQRFCDYIPLYRKFFSAAQKLGAKIFVVHGIKHPGQIDFDLHCERFYKMSKIASEYGVIFAQENVYSHRSQNPEYMIKMQNALGKDFRAVLDVKQAFKSGFSVYDFINGIGGSIVHVHVSDKIDRARLCVPPGKGCFDFESFFAAMDKLGYDGNYIIELYRYSYGEYAEVTQALDYLKKLY